MKYGWIYFAFVMEGEWAFYSGKTGNSGVMISEWSAWKRRHKDWLVGIGLFRAVILSCQIPMPKSAGNEANLRNCFLDFKPFLCFGHDDSQLSCPYHSHHHPQLEDSPASLFLLVDESFRICSFLEWMPLHSAPCVGTHQWTSTKESYSFTQCFFF